jgi:hypothetical protein
MTIGPPPAQGRDHNNHAATTQTPPASMDDYATTRSSPPLTGPNESHHINLFWSPQTVSGLCEPAS